MSETSKQLRQTEIFNNLMIKITLCYLVYLILEKLKAIVERKYQTY